MSDTEKNLAGSAKISPNVLELRNFGLIMATGLMVIFGLFLPWAFDHGIPIWPWVAAFVFAGLAVTWPRALLPLYRIWMKFGHVVGWINTRIILALLFYVIILPAGLLMRLFGKDPMARQLTAEKTSYRVTSRLHDPKSLERPF